MKAKFSSAIETSCQFGDWLFDPADGQLKSGQKNLRLQPRLSKLLSVLVANVNVLLTREELIDILWPDKSVNDDALSRCIAELRSALGDNRTSPIYIETIPKKGYRFIKPLSLKPDSVKPDSVKLDSVKLDSAKADSVKPDSAKPFSVQTDNTKPINVISDKKSSYRPTVLALGLVLFTAIFFSIIKDDDSINLKDPSTRLKSALNAAIRVTADTELEHQPELSNRGDKIAFSVVQNNRMIVRVLSTGGALVHEIKDSDHHLYSATFSDDDQSILLAGINQEKCTIFLYIPVVIQDAGI